MGRMNAATLIAGLDPCTLGPSDSSFAYDRDFTGLLMQTYERYLGKSLAPQSLGPDEASRWLYEDAPFCLLAHNTAADPRFVYANRSALACFEYTWVELTQIPSRLSAETPNQAERQRLIERVLQDGYATGYRGLRFAKSGRQFWIEDVTMWQLIDAAGVLQGQAALYGRWVDA